MTFQAHLIFDACAIFALDILCHFSTLWNPNSPNTFDISLMFDIIKNKRDHIKMPIEY